jgi:hypothetical protein
MILLITTLLIMTNDCPDKYPSLFCRRFKAKEKGFMTLTPGCLLRPGPEECFDKKEVVVQEVRVPKV